MTEEIYTPPVGAFYVYVYRNPLKGNQPFYVGKGTWHGKGTSAERVFQHLYKKTKQRGNPHNSRTIRKILNAGMFPKIHCAFTTDDEHRAFAAERLLIALFGRRCDGGTLTNLTKGGEGISGLRHSEQSKRRMSDSNKGRKLNLGHEVRQRRSESMKGDRNHMHGVRLEGALNPFFGQKHSEVTKQKMKDAWSVRRVTKPLSAESRQKRSMAAKGERNPFFGKTHSDEAKRKISEASKLRIGPASPFGGKTHSGESKRRMTLARLGKKQSPETIEKRRQTIERNRLEKLASGTAEQSDALQ